MARGPRSSPLAHPARKSVGRLQPSTTSARSSAPAPACRREVGRARGEGVAHIGVDGAVQAAQVQRGASRAGLHVEMGKRYSAVPSEVLRAVEGVPRETAEDPQRPAAGLSTLRTGSSCWKPPRKKSCRLERSPRATPNESPQREGVVPDRRACSRAGRSTSRPMRSPARRRSGCPARIETRRATAKRWPRFVQQYVDLVRRAPPQALQQDLGSGVGWCSMILILLEALVSTVLMASAGPLR